MIPFTITTQDRIDRAVEEGEEAFWSVIADAFPESKSGDLPVEVVIGQEDHNKKTVKWWLYYNTKLIGEEDI